MPLTLSAAFNRRLNAVLRLTLLTVGPCLLSAPADARAQTAKQQRSVPKSPPTTKPDAVASYIKAFRGSRFGFDVKSVKQEPPPSTMYRIEGLSADNVLFALSCHSVPPAYYWQGLTHEELTGRLQRYDNIDAFRKNATERVNLASENPEGVMLLFAGEEQKQRESNDPVDEGKRLVNEIFDQCAVLNRIPNGNGIFPVTVISSEFRSWKDRTGYAVEAQTEDESLTLGCARGKGQACHSLPPKTYRAIRRQSQGGDFVALYDADVNPVAIYRILSERSAKRKD